MRRLFFLIDSYNVIRYIGNRYIVARYTGVTMASLTSYLPLTESTYLILLSLLSERHGYGIMQYIEEVSGGRIKIGPGTLYGGLKSIMKKKWIEELGTEVKSRRRCYRLTEEGRALLEAEIERLEELTAIGKNALSKPVRGDE